MLNVQISSRVFSRGFDVRTPAETFSAKSVPLSPTGEILISNGSGFQIARLERESFLSNVYNIIITGGGFYQFDRNKEARLTWTCNGEGRLLRVSESSMRMFSVSDGTHELAECSKAIFSNEYSLTVFNEGN